MDAMTDHEWYEAAKAGEDGAWRRVRERVVEPEATSMRSAGLVRRYSLSTDDLTGRLYEEMIGRGKIALYRDDGGSFAGWLRTYVRGYILNGAPRPHGELSIDGAPGGEEAPAMDVPSVDRGVERAEVWGLTHYCFRQLWNVDPERCYIHVLKTRFFLSSEEICAFLDCSSPANVDQIFSRSIKFMREAWQRNDTINGRRQRR
jgi:hypothetical protein